MSTFVFHTKVSAADMGFLYIMGIAAVTGHCTPVIYGFKGSGGIGTIILL
jgi:glycerol-3-phosphate acyltransferase PlsY